MGREPEIAAATQSCHAALDVLCTGDAAPMMARWSHTAVVADRPRSSASRPAAGR